MKTLTIGLLIILLLSLPLPALAQQPTTEPTAEPTIEATAVPDVTILPDPVTPKGYEAFIVVPAPGPAEPAESAVNGVVLLIGAFAVLVTNFLVTAIKTIPYLSGEDKDKLAVAVTQIVAIAVGVATGYLTSLIAQSLGLIADDSIRNMVIAILTPVLAELRYRVEKLTVRPVVVAPDSEVHTMTHG